MGRLDESFHSLLVQGSGNREMQRVHTQITERIRIIRRRPEEAQRLLRAHIEQSKLEVRHITLDVLYRARQG